MMLFILGLEDVRTIRDWLQAQECQINQNLIMMDGELNYSGFPAELVVIEHFVRMLSHSGDG